MMWKVFDNVALGKCHRPEGCFHRLDHRVPTVAEDILTLMVPATAEDPSLRSTYVVDPSTGEVNTQAWMEHLHLAASTPVSDDERAAVLNDIANWLQPVLQEQVRTQQRLCSVVICLPARGSSTCSTVL